MKKKKAGVKRHRSFDADSLVTALSRAINRDLSVAEQVYGNSEPGLQAALKRQREELLKKFNFASTDQDLLERQAFELFRKTNKYIGRINQGSMFPDPATRITSKIPFMDRVHLRARVLMREVLGEIFEEDWFPLCENSSGSSIGVPYSDTSLERKSRYPLSVTPRAHHYFERYLNWNNQFQLELERFNSGNNKPRYLFVNGARATTVDKDSRKRRFISVEPTVNMFLQQGLMQLMYQRMKRVGLDVESLPDRHRKLAWIGSITGLNATIDWSSASDSVGIELLRWLLPPKWFDILDCVRSPSTTIDGQEETLNMFSTMGNAGTFPLETLVFWTYACAVGFTLEAKTNTSFIPDGIRRRCSVFGDDCIVPSEWAPSFMMALELVGFQVNSEKSFWLESERFRESCGGDYLAGYPVRPWNIKAPSSEKISQLESWLYTILFELQQKYILYFGSLRYVYGRYAFDLIFNTFRLHGIKPKAVPPGYPSDAGVQLDVDRLASIYRNLDWSPVYVSRQGLVSFLYKRFEYKERYKKDDGLRYVEWLRKPPLDPLAIVKTEFVSRRRIGGYIVARGLSPCWDAPYFVRSGDRR